MYACMYACMHVCMYVCMYVWLNNSNIIKETATQQDRLMNKCMHQKIMFISI